MAKLLCWLPQKRGKSFTDSLSSFGHIALKLTNGTYISFYPDGARNEAEDTRGGEFYHVYEIGSKFIDEDRIRDWWDQHRHLTYRYVTYNCCSVVYGALLEGIKLDHDRHQLFSQIKFGRSPYNVYRNSVKFFETLHNLEPSDNLFDADSSARPVNPVTFCSRVTEKRIPFFVDNWDDVKVSRSENVNV